MQQGMSRAEMLGFIEQGLAESDTSLLVASFLAAAQGFGLDACAAGAWTGMGAQRAYRFYFNTWPAEWLAVYAQRQVFFEDPVVAEAQRRMAPFGWDALTTGGALRQTGVDTVQLAREYGWADGLVVPVHGPAGYQGIVSFAARRPLALADADIALLWVASLAVHARCRQTAGMGMGSTPPPSLTRREAECMRWIAAGKTEWETGQLLGIKQATVHFHVERVKRRLGCSTRTAVVALLVLHGLL